MLSIMASLEGTVYKIKGREESTINYQLSHPT